MFLKCVNVAGVLDLIVGEEERALVRIVAYVKLVNKASIERRMKSSRDRLVLAGRLKVLDEKVPRKVPHRYVWGEKQSRVCEKGLRVSINKTT